MLVDPEDRFSYGLNALRAQIRITIEYAPSAIAIDDILDVLETHSDASQNQLANDPGAQLHRPYSLGFIENFRKLSQSFMRLLTGWNFLIIRLRAPVLIIR